MVFINGLSEGDVVKIDPTEYNFYRYGLGAWNKVALPAGVRRNQSTAH